MMMQPKMHGNDAEANSHGPSLASLSHFITPLLHPPSAPSPVLDHSPTVSTTADRTGPQC